ncbi:MAG TPA: RNA polymerase sigma factor [Pyrinomonadaceae bacterium]|jgi:RNA polymerase sigma-70 factor (ECF subfamily)|nr:RNA polymerase sigma factor [Pyrinomonadaceae bacterium]
MKASPEHSDEELLRLIVAGDADAFTTLYRRRQACIYRFALQMCGSEGIAEDVTQEVFLTLVRREPQIFDATRGTLAAYLYGIARNQVLRRLEKERHFVSLVEDTAEDGNGTTEHPATTTRHDPLAELTRHELIESVQQAVLALPAHYREVVVLCELHEMSYAEAAGALGCAVGTVRSRLHRARALLVERLREVRQREAGVAEDFDPLRCFA